MKIWLKSRSDTATPGQSWPTAAPTTIDTRIQVVSERLRHAQNASPAISAQRRISNEGYAWVAQPIQERCGPSWVHSRP